jgi:hypothetical protein
MSKETQMRDVLEILAGMTLEEKAALCIAATSARVRS